MWNKWDLLSEDRAEELAIVVQGSDKVQPVSALTGEGVDQLLEMLGDKLTELASTEVIDLPLSDGRRIAWLHAHGEVLTEEDINGGDDGMIRRLTVRLNPKELGQFETL